MNGQGRFSHMSTWGTCVLLGQAQRSMVDSSPMMPHQMNYAVEERGEKGGSLQGESATCRGSSGSRRENEREDKRWLYFCSKVGVKCVVGCGPYKYLHCENKSLDDVLNTFCLCVQRNHHC